MRFIVVYSVCEGIKSGGVSSNLDDNNVVKKGPDVVPKRDQMQ